jgi:hypothetical protein
VTKGSALVNIGRRREGLGIIDAGYKLGEEQGLVSVMLRALNNSMSNRTEVDPRSTYEGGSAGLVLARRLGQTGWVHAFVGNLAFVSLRTGDFLAGQAELENALADTDDPNERLLLVNNLVDIRAFLGGATEEPLKEMETTIGDSDLVTARVFLVESRAFVAMFGGRLGEARDLWRSLYPLDPANTYAARLWSARLALWAGDADAAEADLTDFWLHAPHDGVPIVSRDLVRAAIAALRGEREVAIDGFRDGFGRLRGYRIPVDEVVATIDVVSTLGPDDPVAVEAIAEARQILARLGAPPLAKLLDDAIDGGGHAPVARRAAGARRTDPSVVADPAG